jgi:hypothetical protein
MHVGGGGDFALYIENVGGSYPLRNDGISRFN